MTDVPDAGERTILRLAAVAGIPEITPGADLVGLIGDAIESDAPLGSAGGAVHDGDILVVTSKIVSKAEGRIVQAEDREDAITAETVRLVASREHPGGVTRIVENRQGLVLAAAGVDSSNTGEGTVLLLPEDPDASARALASGLRERFGRRIGVIVSDTLGRPWREGQTDAAIGAAGVRVLDDLRGSVDAFGRPLAVTMAATADELAAATDLVKGKASGMPVAIVRGMATAVTADLHTPARALVRTGPTDMFRLGTDEALAEGRSEGLRDAERLPAFRSLVFRDLPRPQLLDVATVALPSGVSTDPEIWAHEIFSQRSTPAWLHAAAALGRVLSPNFGSEAGGGTSGLVREGDEVLIPARAGQFDVRCAVGVDKGTGFVRVTTAINARGARARLLLGVAGVVHSPTIRALLARAARRLGGA